MTFDIATGDILVDKNVVGRETGRMNYDYESTNFYTSPFTFEVHCAFYTINQASNVNTFIVPTTSGTLG